MTRMTDDKRLRVNGERLLVVFADAFFTAELQQLKARLTKTLVTRGCLVEDELSPAINVCLMAPPDNPNTPLTIPQPYYKRSSQDIWDKHPDSIAANYAVTSERNGDNPQKPREKDSRINVWHVASIDLLLLKKEPIPWRGYRIDTYRPDEHLHSNLPAPWVNPDPRLRNRPAPADTQPCDGCKKPLQCTTCGRYPKIPQEPEPEPTGWAALPLNTRMIMNAGMTPAPRLNGEDSDDVTHVAKRKRD